MKTILLMRHAKAEAAVPGRQDFARRLAARGGEDALRMGRTLAKLHAVPDTIVASPALRAKETAEAAAKAMKFGGKIQLDRALYDDRLCSPIGGVSHERVPVVDEPGNRNEQHSGSHDVRAIGDSNDRHVFSGLMEHRHVLEQLANLHDSSHEPSVPSQRVYHRVCGHWSAVTVASPERLLRGSGGRIPRWETANSATAANVGAATTPP
jgi:hypothetical protein